MATSITCICAKSNITIENRYTPVFRNCPYILQPNVLHLLFYCPSFAQVHNETFILIHKEPIFLLYTLGVGKLHKYREIKRIVAVLGHQYVFDI